MEYRCVVSSEAGLIQQVVLCVSKGYLWYVAGHIPEGRDPARTDARIIDKYSIGISKWAKARRKRGGGANLQYFRFDRFFVIMATKGEHWFYRDEPAVRDIRRVPLKFAGHSISQRMSTVTGKYHASVRIAPEEYRCVKAYLLEHAVHWEEKRVGVELNQLPFEPYAPVRRQLLNLLRAVNRARKRAGRSQLNHDVLHLKRRVAKVFEAMQGMAEPGGGRASSALMRTKCQCR